MKNHLNPTSPNERIEQIDILRGFALFGVLLVNVFGYNSSFFDFSGFYSQFTDPINSGIFQFVVNYGADKFIGLFSLLFGIGFSMMYLKYQEDEKRFFNLYFRRLWILMFFGIIHIAFFWAGDILFTYSLAGLILLLSRKLPSAWLLFLSIFMYLFPILYIALSVVWSFLPDALSSTSDITLPQVIAIYSEGSYAEVFKLRLEEYFAFRNINLYYYAPKVISLFFFGYLFHRQQMLEKINTSKVKYFGVGIVLLLVGILLNIFTSDIVDSIANAATNPFYTAIYMGVFEITNVFLISSYLLIILVLSQAPFAETILNPLKYVGRMSLTNYISYSIVFTTIMYSYGFGQFGSFQPWQLLVFGFVFFALQLLICRYLLKHFRYGPLEWIWRKWTYGSKIE